MTAKRSSASLGRPVKGGSARKAITIHMEFDKIEIIDEYVAQQRNDGNKGYSRSEFVDEAITEYMKKIGLKAE